jgi:DNA-binding NarL/FixJ family response regulator
VNPSTKPAPWRVLLADDCKVMRRLLVEWLNTSPDFCVAGETADGPGTLEYLARDRPDILLLDFSMPPPCGFELLHLIRSAHPGLPLVVFTVTESSSFIAALAAAGASAYLAKGSGLEALLAALRAVAAGQQYWPVGSLSVQAG